MQGSTRWLLLLTIIATTAKVGCVRGFSFQASYPELFNTLSPATAGGPAVCVTPNSATRLITAAECVDAWRQTNNGPESGGQAALVSYTSGGWFGFSVDRGDLRWSVAPTPAWSCMYFTCDGNQTCF